MAKLRLSIHFVVRREIDTLITDEQVYRRPEHGEREGYRIQITCCFAKDLNQEEHVFYIPSQCKKKLLRRITSAQGASSK